MQLKAALQPCHRHVTNFSIGNCVKKSLQSFACNKSCLNMLHGFAVTLLQLFIKHPLNQSTEDSM